MLTNPLTASSASASGDSAPEDFLSTWTPDNCASNRNYGILSRKKRFDSDGTIGIEFENPPLPSNTPVLFVAHTDKGIVRFVVLSQV